MRAQVKRDHACRELNPSPSSLRETKNARIETPSPVQFSVEERIKDHTQKVERSDQGL